MLFVEIETVANRMTVADPTEFDSLNKKLTALVMAHNDLKKAGEALNMYIAL